MRRIGLQFPPICIVYVFLVFGSCSPFACMCLSVITGFQFVCFLFILFYVINTFVIYPFVLLLWHLMTFNEIWRQSLGTGFAFSLYLLQINWIRLWKSSLSKPKHLTGCYSAWRIWHGLRMRSAKCTVNENRGVDGQPGCLPSAWRKSPYLANIPWQWDLGIQPDRSQDLL